MTFLLAGAMALSASSGVSDTVVPDTLDIFIEVCVEGDPRGRLGAFEKVSVDDPPPLAERGLGSLIWDSRNRSVHSDLYRLAGQGEVYVIKFSRKKPYEFDYQSGCALLSNEFGLPEAKSALLRRLADRGLVEMEMERASEASAPFPDLASRGPAGAARSAEKLTFLLAGPDHSFEIKAEQTAGKYLQILFAKQSKAGSERAAREWKIQTHTNSH